MSTTSRRGRPPGSSGDALLAVAREVLLERGYAGTTMEEVASRAHISKVSLYREHASKSALYAAVVADWAAAGRDAMRPAVDRLVAEPDLRAGLLGLAATMSRGILSPEVLRMRRLVASEAESHPAVAAMYLRESWQRNVAALADGLARLHEQGRLRIDDARTAADQLTWLVIGAPLNAQLLTGETHDPTSTATAAVDLFLAGYGIDLDR